MRVETVRRSAARRTGPVFRRCASDTVLPVQDRYAILIDRNEKIPLLREALPDFSIELKQLLVRAGRRGLAEQIEELSVFDRCRCGDSFCGTFYTAPKPNGSYGPKHENVNLDAEKGMIILDVVDGDIQCVEVLYRDEIRSRLQDLLPFAQ